METMRKWVHQAEVRASQRPGISTGEAFSGEYGYVTG